MLTDAVDLDGYGRVVYEAITYEDDGGALRTEVRFSGPKNIPGARDDADDDGPDADADDSGE